MASSDMKCGSVWLVILHGNLHGNLYWNVNLMQLLATSMNRGVKADIASCSTESDRGAIALLYASGRQLLGDRRDHVVTQYSKGSKTATVYLNRQV